MKPLVSVVMATYAGDEGEALAQAVDSILAQDYAPLELLIAIDGPVPPARQAYLEGLAAQPGVRLLPSAVNRGPAAARNRAIAAAQGDYIAIADADDWSAPGRITQQVAFLEAQGLDVMSGALAVLQTEAPGDWEGASLPALLRALPRRTVPEAPSAVQARAPLMCPMANPALFARAAVLKAHPFREDFRVAEDYELWVRLLRQGYRLGNGAEPWVIYRQQAAALGRRQGWAYARNDFLIKLSALPLLPWGRRPLALLLALGASALRLAPRALFLSVYRWRLRRQRPTA